MGNKIGLYHPITLGQGLKVLKEGDLMVLRHTEVDTGEVQTVPDHTEGALMTTEGDLVRGVDLMDQDSMVHPIDSTPQGDEVVS